MIAFVTSTVTSSSETLAVSPFQDSVNECKLRSLDAIRGLTPHDRMIAIYITSSNLPAANMTSRSSFVPWIKTFKLSVPFYLGLLPFVSVFWCAIIGTVLTREPLFLVYAGFAGLAAAAIYLAQWGIWALFLKLLWSDPPRWLRAAPWHRQPIHFGVGLMAALPLALILMAHAPAQQIYPRRAAAEFLTTVMLRYSWVWVGAVAALYNLVKRWLD